MAVTHSFNLNYYEDGTLVETETLYRDENTHTSDREVNGVFYYYWDGSAYPNLFTNTLYITSQTVVYIDDGTDMIPLDEYLSQEIGSVITYTISNIVIPLNDVSKLSDGTNTYIIKDVNAIHTSDISSAYSPTGTAPINGIAVANAINGMTITSINTNPALTSSTGICTWTITESKSPICECIIYETSTGKEVFPDISYGSGSITIKINSESNISANTYTAIVIG